MRSISKTTKPERPRIASFSAKPAPKPVPMLLVPRATACKMLSISIATAIRLEAAGRLTAIKLFPSSNAKTHYRVSEVNSLADEG